MRRRILFAWELGANYGHASTIAETARAIGDRAEIRIAARDPIAVRRIAPDLNAVLLPAPYAPPAPIVGKPQPDISYPHVLRHCGWGDAASLSALLEAWSNLFDLVRPDVLAVNAAPTALLAARGRALPTALIGSGYDAPPRAEPAAPFFFWVKGRADDAAPKEKATLTVANDALAAQGAPPLAAFADLLRVDRYLLATIAEIDHYAPRAAYEPGHPPYLGQLVSLTEGAETLWRSGPATGPRIFAYLRPGAHGFDAAVAALAARSDADVILAAPGAPEALKARLAGGHVRLIDGPVRLDRILPQCDCGVSHASNGVAAAFLTHGLPQVCLPTQAEQIMVARALATQRLAVSVFGEVKPEQAAEAIGNALSIAEMRANAQAAAARVRAGPGIDPAPRIAEAVLSLAAGDDGR